jgi:hypothetical protein
VDRARGDQQGRADRSGDERDEEHILLERRDPRPAARERYGEQEGEEHLDARQRDPELVEELDQLTVVSLLRALIPVVHRADDI